MIDNPPKTLDEAVNWLLDALEDEDKDLISRCKTRGEMIGLTHHGLGTCIRNEFGLWNGNDELVEDLTQHHPKKRLVCKGDDASGIILDKLWDILKGKHE